MNTDELRTIVSRGSALEVLSREPMDRRDLQAHLDVSRPTVHRLTKALEEDGLIERINGDIALTTLGEMIANEVYTFHQRVETARQLTPVLEAVQDLPVEFDLDYFVDATITRPGPGNPYRPVNRFMSLLTTTETLRGLDPASINPLHVDELHQAIVSGMKTDAIYLPAVVDEILETNPERTRTAFESGNLTLRTHTDLPFGLTICDQRIGIGIYDDRTGLLELYVDTDDLDARAWAEDVYALYLADAKRVEWPIKRVESQ